MNRWAIAIVLLAALTSLASAQTTPQSTVVEVKGPTVIAFFESTPERDGDNEALSDFQWYASQVRPKLEKKGITFQQFKTYLETHKKKNGEQKETP